MYSFFNFFYVKLISYDRFFMKFIKVNNLHFILILVFVLSACSNNDDILQEDPDKEVPIDNLSKGKGLFRYIYNETNFTKTINIYYYIPVNKTSTTPIVFVFHGNGRNAKDYRNAMIAKADEFGFIAIVPEFSEQNFPGGDGYNLGNVFIDGDNPSPSSLNSEEEWTFSLIEPIFNSVKSNINNTTSKYHMIGHSAGAQFAHRFAMFKPNARFDKVVVSAAGWYTVPDETINFPYGFKESPLENRNLLDLFSKNIIIQVGELDNNPNSSGLRHNQFADSQGLNRYKRANYFFNNAHTIAQNNTLSFAWKLYINEGLDHSFQPALEKAADLLFN